MSQCLPFPHFCVADGPKLLDDLKDQNADAVDLDYLVDNFKSVQTTTAPTPSQNADAVDLDCLVDNFKSVQATTVPPPSQNADAVDSEYLDDTFNSVQTTTVPPLSICIVFSELLSPGFWFQPNITVLDSSIPAAFRSIDLFRSSATG